MPLFARGYQSPSVDKVTGVVKAGTVHTTLPEMPLEEDDVPDSEWLNYDESLASVFPALFRLSDGENNWSRDIYLLGLLHLPTKDIKIQHAMADSSGATGASFIAERVVDEHRVDLASCLKSTTGKRYFRTAAGSVENESGRVFCSCQGRARPLYLLRSRVWENQSDKTCMDSSLQWRVHLFVFQEDNLCSYVESTEVRVDPWFEKPVKLAPDPCSFPDVLQHLTAQIDTHVSASMLAETDIRQYLTNSSQSHQPCHSTLL